MAASRRYGDSAPRTWRRYASAPRAGRLQTWLRQGRGAARVRSPERVCSDEQFKIFKTQLGCSHRGGAESDTTVLSRTLIEIHKLKRCSGERSVLGTLVSPLGNGGFAATGIRHRGHGGATLRHRGRGGSTCGFAKVGGRLGCARRSGSARTSSLIFKTQLGCSHRGEAEPNNTVRTRTLYKSVEPDRRISRSRTSRPSVVRRNSRNAGFGFWRKPPRLLSESDPAR